MLIVLLQRLCSKIWDSEFILLWQHWIRHCVCSLVYINRPLKAQLIVHNDSRFLITMYACLMSHTHYMNQPFTLLSSIILIISGGRYNLLSYTLRSFLQYPITFSYENLRNDQHCFQTQSTALPQCHRHSVTPKAIKILRKHTYTYVYI